LRETLEAAATRYKALLADLLSWAKVQSTGTLPWPRPRHLARPRTPLPLRSGARPPPVGAAALAPPPPPLPALRAWIPPALRMMLPRRWARPLPRPPRPPRAPEALGASSRSTTRGTAPATLWRRSGGALRACASSASPAAPSMPALAPCIRPTRVSRRPRCFPYGA
jgi:hypothetical protein